MCWLVTWWCACLPVLPLQAPEAGFFGTTNRFWFFRADRASQAMYVTNAVHCHSESPSVRQMLYLLLCLRGTPLPTDVVQWPQGDYNRILVDEIGQDSQQRQQGQQGQQEQQACWAKQQDGSGQQDGTGQQGGTGQQSGTGQQDKGQGPVTMSQVEDTGASDQQAPAALTSCYCSRNITPFEEFQDRIPIGAGETGTVYAAW